ncbi:hypothetical protein BDW74DRAFT_156275 [Aspergillus multicolor]|uniref:lytic polysaccharide monooxygenase AA11 family protein n=1 Tax=Aspergillus multicolor TaxID=41759 RepID=UPI003CCD3BB5
MFAKSLAAAAIFGFSLVNGHMLMTNPVPYSKDSLNNSPILADGSDFPCKNTDYTVSTENHLTKGQPFNIEFQGSATHGGGSCQISITSDRAPTKDTKWSVIQSIEGGCMDESEGNSNQGNDAGMKSAFSPSVTIPDDFEDGQYTLAWTWINRIGNREFYMNCAPVTLSGGSSSKRSKVATVEKRAGDYPDMFIANINGCKTKDNKSPRYPNPGSNLVSYNEANLIPESEDVCYTGSPTWGDSGFSDGTSSAEPTVEGDSSEASSTPAAPTEAATTETTPTETTPTEATTTGWDSGDWDSGDWDSSDEDSTEWAPTAAATTPAVSIGGAVAVPDFTGAPAAAQNTEPAAVVSTPSSTFQSVAAPTAAPTSPSTGYTSTAGALSGSCTDEGSWNCIGGSSFQRCASGTWTDVQTLAGGTECTPGQNVNFAVKAVKVNSRMQKEKRSRRRPHGHINIHS